MERDGLGFASRGPTRDDHDCITGINVTPLVDVVLVLLVVLMVSGVALTRAIDLDTRTGEGAPAEIAPLTLTVSADEALSVDGEPTEWGEL